jgi:hypothetical protein
MKRFITRSKGLLLVAALAVLAALCTGYPAHAAASSGTGRVSAAASSNAAASSTPCNLTHSTGLCQSTDPTVSVSTLATGTVSDCTFSWTFNWGDGDSTPATEVDPPDGWSVVAHHTYGKPGLYTLTATGYATGANCTLTPFTAMFRLLSASPPVFDKIYSGYLTPFAAKYHHVSSTWHIPTLNCAASAPISGASQWIGLGGVTIGKQVSTPLVQVGIVSGCVAGLQINVPFWQVVPGNNAQLLAHLPRPGDEIVAEVDYLGNGKYFVGIKDSTAGWIDGGQVPFKVSGKVPTTAEWIVEPGDLVHGKKNTTASLADFGSVTFAGASYSTAAATSQGVTLGGTGSVTPIVLEQETAGRQWTTVSSLAPPGKFTITYIPGGL